MASGFWNRMVSEISRTALSSFSCQIVSSLRISGVLLNRVFARVSWVMMNACLRVPLQSHMGWRKQRAYQFPRLTRCAHPLDVLSHGIAWRTSWPCLWFLKNLWLFLPKTIAILLQFHPWHPSTRDPVLVLLPPWTYLLETFSYFQPP